MARIYGEIASSALMTFDKSFSRSNGQPLDSTEVYYSKAAAEAYALTDVAYVGQKLVVVETKDDVTTVAHYGIEADGSLKELGAIPVGDGMTVEVIDGKIQLAALEGHTEGTYQPYLVDGKIEWRVPSATTVEGLDGRLTTAEGEIDDLQAGIANVYTKTEADEKFAPVGDYATKEEAQGYADAKDEAIAAAKQAGDDAQADVDALAELVGQKAVGTQIDEKITDLNLGETYETKGAAETVKGEIEGVIGDVAEGKTVVEMIEDAQATATYNDTQVKADIQANADAIAAIEEDYLKAADKYDDTALAARVTANEGAIETLNGNAETAGSVDYKIAQAVAAIMENPDETMNSINELVTWINDHAQDALELSNQVSANKGDIEALEGLVGTTGVGAQIEAAIAEALKIDGVDKYALAADLTAAIARIATLEGKAHEHANKALLDTYTQTEADLADAVAKKHAHENATVLEGITAEKVAAWDAAEGNAKTYADEGLAGKVDKVDGESLISTTLIDKLNGIEAEAQKNQIETVDEAQFGLTDRHLTLLDIAMGKVTGLQDALDAKADKATTLAGYGITDAYTKEETLDKIAEKITEINGGESAGEVLGQLNSYKETNNAAVADLQAAVAEKVDKAEGKSLIDDTLIAKLEAIEAGAQKNKIEQIKLGDTLLEIVEKTVVIPIYASEEVTISETGVLGIGQVGVSKLVNDGTELILNGGAAQ